jgi:hypothetical protein
MGEQIGREGRFAFEYKQTNDDMIRNAIKLAARDALAIAAIAKQGVLTRAVRAMAARDVLARARRNAMMRAALVMAVTVMGVMAVVGGCGTAMWDEVPGRIQEFIAQYWPGSTVSAYDVVDGEYHVTIKDGASLVFDSEYNWLLINGNGVAIPSILIYDEMPHIYTYLLARELTHDLMIAENLPRVIILTFTDIIIEYTKSTSSFRMITNAEAG